VETHACIPSVLATNTLTVSGQAGILDSEIVEDRPSAMGRDKMQR